ncbi:MAG TPA: hypothetical protein VJH92_04420 [Candidatus Nanoarchaeia archaeon]|nr:hypothetical protein [Candidatus Nanoarchaeia archaeon]
MVEGLARLARHERIRMLRQNARDLRNSAASSSIEYDWVQSNYELAREYEAKAKKLEDSLYSDRRHRELYGD